jgi:hypothetical protein
VAREALGSTANLAGRDHVRTDEGALVTFSTDATPPERGHPDAVVFPATAEEVAAVLRTANQRRVPVVPRGSGTNLSAGTVPHRGAMPRTAPPSATSAALRKAAAGAPWRVRVRCDEVCATRMTFVSGADPEQYDLTNLRARPAQAPRRNRGSVSRRCSAGRHPSSYWAVLAPKRPRRQARLASVDAAIVAQAAKGDRD